MTTEDKAKHLEYTNSRLLVEISSLNMKLFKYELKDSCRHCIQSQESKKGQRKGKGRKPSIISNRSTCEDPIETLKKENQSLAERALSQLAEKELANLELRQELETLRLKIAESEEAFHTNCDIEGLKQVRNNLLCDIQNLESDLLSTQAIKANTLEEVNSKECSLLYEIELLQGRYKALKEESIEDKARLYKQVKDLNEELDSLKASLTSKQSNSADCIQTLRNSYEEKLSSLQAEISYKNKHIESLSSDLSQAIAAKERLEKANKRITEELERSKSSLKELIADLDRLRSTHEREKEELEEKVSKVECQSEIRLTELINQFSNEKIHRPFTSRQSVKLTSPSIRKLVFDHANSHQVTEICTTQVDLTTRGDVSPHMYHSEGITLNDIFDESFEECDLDRLSRRGIELERYKEENNLLRENYWKVIGLYDRRAVEFRLDGETVSRRELEERERQWELKDLEAKRIIADLKIELASLTCEAEIRINDLQGKYNKMKEFIDRRKVAKKVK